MSPTAMACGVCLVIGLLGGGWVGSSIAAVELDALRAAHATEKMVANGQALAALLAAQRRGDALSAELQAATESTQALQDQLHDALARVTTGRPCLGGNALRVLDRAARPAADVPPAARVPDAADAASTATDTQVAQWANAAYGQYATCARRLDALIDWHPETTPGSQ